MALTSFTAICRLRDDADVEQARTRLSRLQTTVNSPFHTGRVAHYARMQIIDALATDERRPLDHPFLVLSADVDGPIEAFLRGMLTEHGDDLASILGSCADAPADASTPTFVDDAATFLLSHELPIGLRYENSPGHTVMDIRRAVDRHKRFTNFVLTHQHESAEVRRAAFLEQFAPRSTAAAGEAER